MQQIKKLKSVFEERYNFTVSGQSLNPICEKKTSAQKLLQKCLANFVYEEDQPNTLLIVYYAGHGNPAAEGGLLLQGCVLHGLCPPCRKLADLHRDNNSTGDRNVDQVAWNQAEQLIHTAEEADVLLIFDCCFAGKLCGMLDKRYFSQRIFEFLGATVANGYARLPGKDSFTSALIWALKELADEKDGFTTSKLYSTILKAPHFPEEDQPPVLSERRGQSLKRLVLAPVQLDTGNNGPAGSLVGAREQVETPAGHDGSPIELNVTLPGHQNCSAISVTLQLVFREMLTSEELKKMCDGLKELIRSGELKAEQIICRAMEPKGASAHEIPRSAKRAAFTWLDRWESGKRGNAQVCNAQPVQESCKKPRRDLSPSSS